MSLPFGPPQPVSPLIRGLRWGLLLAGIVYAQGKQRLYNRLEAHHREEEAKKKVIRDKQKAIEKARLAAEEKESIRLLETGKLFDPNPYANDTSDKPRPKKN